MTDADVVALTVWGESRGEPIEGQIAVACVIRNRLALGRWGATFAAVCQAPKQFSCWNAGSDPNHQALLVYADHLLRGVAILGDPHWRQAQWIASGVVAGVLLDTVRHATYYHTIQMDPLPAWAVGKTPVCRVANHLFYAGIV